MSLSFDFDKGISFISIIASNAKNKTGKQFFSVTNCFPAVLGII